MRAIRIVLREFRILQSGMDLDSRLRGNDSVTCPRILATSTCLVVLYAFATPIQPSGRAAPLELEFLVGSFTPGLRRGLQ